MADRDPDYLIDRETMRARAYDSRYVRWLRRQGRLIPVWTKPPEEEETD